MPAPRHCDVAAGSVDLHGRAVRASDAASLSDVRAAPDVQPVTGRGNFYVGSSRVADDRCGPRRQTARERVQTVVQVDTDDVVDVAEDEAQTSAGRRSATCAERNCRPAA